MMKSHKPEWFDSSSNPTYTTYEHNPDDTVSMVMDPRGAKTFYEYGLTTNPTEHRALLTKVWYWSPNSTTIPTPGEVNFTYDPAGNRKTMLDASGSLTYSYDELSRIASEIKAFAGSDAPTGPFTLQYSYHLSGGIKSIADPSEANGWEVTYTSDKVGRVTAVGAQSGFPVQQFATGISYRAFGGVKSMAYPTTQVTSISLTYDDRLRPTTYAAGSSTNTTDIHNKTYSYNNDGSIKQATNTLEADYTQTYEYDFAARLKKNDMGGTSGPYKQTLGYDAFDHLTSRSTTHDGTTRSFTAGYTNNRIASGGFGPGPSNDHDAAGNVTFNRSSTNDYRSWTFDAAGRVTNWGETTVYVGITRWDQGETITFDGDGRVAKRIKRKQQLGTSPPSPVVSEPVYHLYSSVLGKEIAESSAGQWLKKIYFNGTVIAEQTPYTWGLVFKHTDPVSGSEMQTKTTGEVVDPELGRTERAALREVIPTTTPETSPPPHSFEKGASTHDPQSGCEWNGTPFNCDHMDFVIRNYNVAGIAVRIQGHENTHGPSTMDMAVSARGSIETRNRICDAAGNNCGPWNTDNTQWFRTDPPSKVIATAISDAETALKNTLCQGKIEELLANAFRAKVNYNTLSADEQKEIDKYIATTLTAANLIQTVRNATQVPKPEDMNLNNKDGHADAETTGPQGSPTITFYMGFFNKIYSGKDGINDKDAKPYKGERTTPEARAAAVIHEGIHAVERAFSDGYTARFTFKQPKKKDLDKIEGSQAITDYVNRYCF